MFGRRIGVVCCGLVFLAALSGCTDPSPGELVASLGAALNGRADTQPAGPAASLNYPVRSKAWTFGNVGGAKLSTENYNIFTTLPTGTARQNMPAFMEAAHENYLALTGLTNQADLNTKLPVYLFADRGQWAALTEKVTGPAAPIYLKVQNGGYCYEGKCVFWYIGTRGTLSVASHEGMHQFLHHATRQSLPIWAEEGLAVQSEGFQMREGLVRFDARENHSRWSTLRKLLMTDRWRPTRQLVAMSAAENVEESGLTGADFYAQLWSMLLMIRSDPQYAEGLRQLCRDAAAGTIREALEISPPAWGRLQRNAQAYVEVVGPKAFAHYIDADTDRFEARYRAFARELANMPEVN